MQIDIQITGATLADLRRLLGVGNAPHPAEPLPVEDAALEARIEAHQAEAPADVADVSPADAGPADAVDPEPVAPAARASGKSVTLSDGKVAKPDDTVLTASGEVGIIVSVSRGSAVVTFEDSREEKIAARDLTLYVEPVDAGEPEPTPEEGEIDADALRAIGRQVLNKLGAARTQAIVKEVSGAAKLSEVPADKYGAVHAALSAALV